MRIKKRISALLVAILALAAMQSASAGDQDFELFNRTGFDVYAVYVSPSGVEEWEEDVLGADILLAGASIDITFDRDEDAKFWDIRVEDDEGDYIEWTKIDLLTAYQVILEPDGVARIK